MKKPIIFLTTTGTLIIVLSIVQAVISSRLSTYGVELSKIEQEINAYKKENSILMEIFLKEASYNRVASRAAEIGFTDTETISLNSPVVARSQ